MTNSAENETKTTDDSVSSGPGNQRSFGALRHRDFVLFWLGFFISTTGSWVQGLAQGWLVYELTGSKLYLGVVSAVSTLPFLFLSLPCGVIADRFSKRKITIITQTLAMVHAFALAALVFSGVIKVWHIIALSAYGGIIAVIDVPARQAMTSELVKREDLLNAVALNSSAFNAARIVGPAIAGIVVAVHGTAMCFLINGISYIAVLISLFMIHPKSVKVECNGESMLAQMREGLHYSRKNVLIRDLLALTAIASIFGLNYATLMPAFARDVLKVGPEGLGVLMSAAGLGALVAAIAIAGLGHMFRRGAIVTVGSMLAPLGLIALSLSNSYFLSITWVVFIGFGMMLFLAVSNSIMQYTSPDELRGRVLSLRNIVFGGLVPIGSLQVATLAHYLGVKVSIFIGGAIWLVAAIYFAICSRAIQDA